MFLDSEQENFMIKGHLIYINQYLKLNYCSMFEQQITLMKDI